MPRDIYLDVMTKVTAVAVTTPSGTQTLRLLEPLDNVQVTVYRVAVSGARSGSPAQLYAARTGSTPKTNPFVSDANGRVEFWADPGDYDILFHDLAAQPRIGDQSISWNAVSGQDEGLALTQLPGKGRGLAPAGSMFNYAGISLPDGYLWCDGSLQTRVAYPALYAAIGDAYATGGETSAQFRLPDYRGRANIGPDNFGQGAAGRVSAPNNVRGKGGGAEKHVLAPNEMPAHEHLIWAVRFYGATPAAMDSNPGWLSEAARGAGAAQNAAAATTAGAGSSFAHNNMQPYTVSPVIIKT